MHHHITLTVYSTVCGRCYVWLIHFPAVHSSFFHSAVCAYVTVSACVVYEWLVPALPRGHRSAYFIILQSQRRKTQSPLLFFRFFSNSANTECFPYFPLSLSDGQCRESKNRFVALFRLRDCKPTMVIKCVLYIKFSKVLSKIAAGLLIVSIIIRCLLCLVWCDTYMKASALKYVKVFYGSVYLSVCKTLVASLAVFPTTVQSPSHSRVWQGLGSLEFSSPFTLWQVVNCKVRPS